jgi:hypothetical protein
MSQTSYSQYYAAAIAGLLADMGNREVLSRKAEGTIAFGTGLVRAAENANTEAVRNPVPNINLLTFSAAFTTDNVFNGDLLGVALGPVTFDTSSVATISLIAAAMASVDGIASATPGTNSITITADPGVNALLENMTITDGASQATMTQAKTTADVFAGAAVAQGHVEQSASGVAQYAVGDAVNLLSRGRIYVPVDQTVTPADTPHLRYTAGAGASVVGSFRKDTDSGKAMALTGCRFVQGATAGGLAILEINLP